MNAADILQWWEQGRHLPALQRAVWYLHCDDPQCSGVQLQQLPIGERDRRLLALRARIFGPALHVYTACPQCGAELEYQFDSEPLYAESLGQDDGPSLTFQLDGVRIRLLNTDDQLRLSRMPAERAEPFILEQCVQVPEGGAELPLEQVLAAMLREDPLAEIMLQLQCGRCRYAWPQILDIVEFFQIELDDFARTLLQQVHMLARAYGWAERDILALSAERRASYLEMVLA
jgi:hypothetical protein